MNLKNEEKNICERNDFMFYESFKDKVDMVRKDNPETPEAAGNLCMAIIRLGVRREWTENLPPEQRAFLRTIEPLMERSKEKKEETIKARAKVRERYARQKKDVDPPEQK